MMTAARSMTFFGVYLLLIGIPQVLFPQAFYSAFQVPTPSDHTAFILASVTIALGFYYIICAAHEVTIFYQASVVGRLFVSSMAFYSVMNGMAAPTIIPHFAIEFVSALMTGWLLWGEGHSPVPLPPRSRGGKDRHARPAPPEPESEAERQRALDADRALMVAESARIARNSRMMRHASRPSATTD